MPYPRSMIRGSCSAVALSAVLVLATGCSGGSDSASPSVAPSSSSAPAVTTPGSSVATSATATTATAGTSTATSSRPAASASDWSGDYRGPDGLKSLMQITSSLEIVWTGGEDDSLGAGTAASCVATARARVVDAHHLRAYLVPSDVGQDASPGTGSAATSGDPLVLTRSGSRVQVEGLFPECGLQVRFAGWWKRTGPVTPISG